MRARLPFLLGAGAFLGHTVLFVRAILRHTGGTYCYPLDDAFIHLAIAKHLAFDGVFGVTKYAFSSASSSIAWPLMLAAIARIAGDHSITPLLLNVALGLVLLWVIARLLRLQATPPRPVLEALVLMTVTFVTPLPTLAITGMEHTLHALATVLLIEASAKALASDAPRPRAWKLLLLASLVTAARYEGLFAVGVVAALAMIRKRWSAAACVAAGGAAPVVAFGAYSMAHGAMFLPNSVLLKGRHFVFRDASDVGDLLGRDLLSRLTHQPHVCAVVVAAFAAALYQGMREGAFSRGTLRSGIVGLAALAHVELASLGWFFRYEAYLVTAGMTVAGMALVKYVPRLRIAEIPARARAQPTLTAFAALLVLAALAPLLERGIEAADTTPLACRNIFQQQVQSARFLARYFGHQLVAVNDIGAVGYYGDEPILDLMGLASMPVARAKQLRLEEPIPRRDFDELTRASDVAIVYDGWLSDRISPRWTRLARWVIDGNRTCAFADVSVYATRPEAIPALVEALQDFSPHLPAGVHQEGAYIEPEVPGDPGAAPLGVGDVLYVELQGTPDYEKSVKVRPDGSLPLPPEIDRVLVRGRSVDDVADLIRGAAAAAGASGKQVAITGVQVRRLERSGIRVYATGRVDRGGEFESREPITAQALLERAGASPLSLDSAYVLRQEHAGFRRLPIAAHGDEASGPLELRARDIVVVP